MTQRFTSGRPLKLASTKTTAKNSSEDQNIASSMLLLGQNSSRNSFGKARLTWPTKA